MIDDIELLLYTFVPQKPQLDGLTVGRGYGVRRLRRGTSGAGSSVAAAAHRDRRHSSVVSTRHSSLVCSRSRPQTAGQGSTYPAKLYHPYNPHSRVTSVFFFLNFCSSDLADGRRRRRRRRLFIFNYNITNIPTNVLLFFLQTAINNHRFAITRQHWSRQRLFDLKIENFTNT